MALPEYRAKAEKLIAENPYLMLSKSWCPDCHYVEKIWNDYNVFNKIHIIELDKFEDQDEAIKLEAAFTEISGRKWVPSLFFNGKFFGNEQDIKNWKSEGKLDKIFQDEKLIKLNR